MVTEESPLRDFARLIVWYPFRWLVSASDPSQGLEALALLGRIHYRCSKGKRRMLMENLEVLPHIPGPPQVPANVVEQYFETHYLSQLLIFLFPRLNSKNILSIHNFAGLQHLEDGLARGKGCLLLHAHFGPVHLPLFHLGLLGYNVKQIGYLRKPRGLSRVGEKVSFRLREQYEKLIPAEIVQANRFMGGAFRHLKNNGVLMATADGTGRGEFMGSFEPFSFLGQKMLFPLGPAKLAGKTGTTIIPMFTIKQGSNHRYTTVIENPLTPAAHKTDEKEITARFLEIFELYTKRYPGLWHFWDEFRKGQLLV